MSYPAFGETGAQPQQPAQEHGGFGATGGPDQQQNPMGQQMDQTQPQGQFQGPPTSGTPGAQTGQPQEGKTTLW